MITARPFYYLRHGETDWNREGRMQGSADIPLNETGMAQAERARDLLKGIEISRIVCSPLQRARQTAEIVNRELQLPITYIDNLREAHFGVQEGTMMGDWFHQWRLGADIEEAEPCDVFIERSRRAINEAIEEGGGTPLIVAHGAVYWAVKRYCRVFDDVPLPNSVPVFHEPIGRRNLPWRAKFLEEAETETIPV